MIKIRDRNGRIVNKLTVKEFTIKCIYLILFTASGLYMCYCMLGVACAIGLNIEPVTHWEMFPVGLLTGFFYSRSNFKR